jgi:hypothetical protein
MRKHFAQQMVALVASVGKVKLIERSISGVEQQFSRGERLTGLRHILRMI